jgi:branched-chain amino acid transport system ATP-binding protein
MSLLEVTGLNTYYGDSHILFDVSLAVERNEVVALLVMAPARARP